MRQGYVDAFVFLINLGLFIYLIYCLITGFKNLSAKKRLLFWPASAMLVSGLVYMGYVMRLHALENYRKGIIPQCSILGCKPPQNGEWQIIRNPFTVSKNFMLCDSVSKKED